MAELEQKIGYVYVHVPTHRDQKISIVQKTTCYLYICNLWGLFRCCWLGDWPVFVIVVLAFVSLKNLEIYCTDGALQAKVWRDSHIKGGVTRAAV